MLFVVYFVELGSSCKTAGEESLSLLSLMKTGTHYSHMYLNSYIYVIGSE